MIDGIGRVGGGMASIDPAAMQQRREQMFARMDQDGDGSLDKVEFSAMAEKMSQRTGDSINVEDKFPEIDTDSDGKLSQDELAAHAAEHRPPPPPPRPQMTGGFEDETTQTLLDLLMQEEEEESVNLLA